MNWNLLIKKEIMECPLCDEFHEVEKRKRNTTILIKGEEIEYEETYYFCQNSDEDENEFVTGGMENINLLSARNAYREKQGLLTSDEIVKIRTRYGLSQVDLAKLLGWGEATISRYESKAIQDQAYDNILRMIKDNPFKAYEFWKKNKDKFALEKRLAIRQSIIINLYAYGHEYLRRQELESEYIKYQEPSDANGNQILNIEKLESIVSYFAKAVPDLYKVKLMKMLWYADSLCFKLSGKSITGLVYCHNNMGALPIGHYRIVGLENIKVKEEEGLDYTRYHFMPNEKLNMDCLLDNEIDILDRVISKFKSYSAQDIVDYMHAERAYKETKDGEIIPFSLAKKIREF